MEVHFPPGTILIINPTSTTTYSVSGLDDNACDFTSMLNLVVNVCSSLGSANDPLFLEASIYPNPNTGEFTLINNGLSGNITAEIYDSPGRLIQSKVGIGDSTMIDIKSSPPGMYLIRISENDKIMSVKKIMKQ